MNLFDPSQIQKITSIGKECQTHILPLNIYGNGNLLSFYKINKNSSKEKIEKALDT